MGRCGCARRGEARAENGGLGCFVTGYGLARQVKARKKMKKAWDRERKSRNKALSDMFKVRDGR
jgi:hypothetical protein